MFNSNDDQFTNNNQSHKSSKLGLSFLIKMGFYNIDRIIALHMRLKGMASLAYPTLYCRRLSLARPINM